jgi:hypothetical protein
MRTTVLAGVAAVMAIICGSASAATFCVPSGFAGCDASEPTLAAAVQAANDNGSGVDDIVLAAGTFPQTNVVASVSNPVHIVGAGIGVTILEGATSGTGLTLYGPDQSIAGLAIHEPDHGHTTALYLDGGVARNVRVDQRDNSNGSASAVALYGGASFLDGEALARTTTIPTTYGIYVSNDTSEPSLVSNASAQGGYGINAAGSGATTIRFARVTGNFYGVMAAADDTLVEDSIVSGGPLVSYLSTGTADILTNVRHVTLHGTYAGVQSYLSGHTARMIVSNTAVVGGGPDPETPDLDIQTSSGAVGRIEADYSFFRAAHVIQSGTGIDQYAPGAHNVDGADAKVLDDLRPRFGSPLIDAGDPVPAGGEPMADIAGELRAVNGRTDIGAYEYGWHTPTVAVFAGATSSAIGNPITFKAAPNDADPSELPDVTWTFDDGTTASGLTVAHAFTTAGTHLATATATDPAGLSASAGASVTIFPGIVPAKAMAPAFGFKKLKARRGVVGVLLSCPVLAADCSGTVELRLAPKPKAKGVATKTVVLGRKHYALAHGTHKTIRVKLTKGGRKRLRRARHGLLVKVVAKPHGAASKSKTVRLTGR